MADLKQKRVDEILFLLELLHEGSHFGVDAFKQDLPYGGQSLVREETRIALTVFSVLVNPNQQFIHFSRLLVLIVEVQPLNEKLNVRCKAAYDLTMEETFIDDE